MSNPSDVFKTNKDDVVSFKYNGGTLPGVVRVVRVRSVDSKGFGGNDFYADDSNNYRRFEFSKIFDFKVLHREEPKTDNVTYDNELGLVIKRKSGDALSLSINKNYVSASFSKNGTTADKNVSVVVEHPSDGKVVEALLGLFKQISQ